ncbi:MAG TPA: MBL fold metallo-hydrolase [Bryobacteraceae bacterium]|nr:MBL fold metallo-hydrolase [Bryobacteraceae bacterium]
MRTFAFAVLLAGVLGAAQTDEFSTSAGPVKITPIQHASFMIEAGGKVIHVDPSGPQNFEGAPAADLILLTDIHGDHLDAAAMQKVLKTGTAIFAPPAAIEKVPAAKPIKNGQAVDWDGWKIEAIPAYNMQRGPSPGKFYHEKGRGNGYVMTYGGKRFYIAGDTEAIPEMKALKDIDVAFVPMNLPYTMTPEEAAEAVRAFRPKVVYPYHYRNSDLKAFESALAGTGVDVRLRDWYK